MAQGHQGSLLTRPDSEIDCCIGSVQYSDYLGLHEGRQCLVRLDLSLCPPKDTIAYP